MANEKSPQAYYDPTSDRVHGPANRAGRYYPPKEETITVGAVYGGGGPATAGREPCNELDAWLAQLDVAVGDLAKRSDLLHDQLQPLLVSEPEPAAPPELQGHAAPVRTPVTQRLSVACARLQAIENALGRTSQNLIV